MNGQSESEMVRGVPWCTPCTLGIHSCCTERVQTCGCTSARHVVAGPIAGRTPKAHETTGAEPLVPASESANHGH